MRGESIWHWGCRGHEVSSVETVCDGRCKAATSLKNPASLRRVLHTTP